jgi:hypothetical protein
MPLTDREKELLARACDATCEETVQPEQIEYEFTVENEGTWWFHIRCHAIWQLAASDDRVKKKR